MHPTAFATESAITQDRLVAASRRIGAALNIVVDIPDKRTQGDKHQCEVSGLYQMQAIAAFLEQIGEALAEKTATTKRGK